MTDEFPDDGFIFTFPLFSYLIEPGPRPGFLRVPGTETVYVPLWTDSDLFLTYVERSELAGKVSGLTIGTQAELIHFLRSIPKQIEHVIVDPVPKAPAQSVCWRIADLISQFSKQAN